MKSVVAKIQVGTAICQQSDVSVPGPLGRILIGMHDDDSGMDLSSLNVRADFDVNGVTAGENLASRFREKSQGVGELKLSPPLTKLATGILAVSVRDRQGHWSRIERRIHVGR